MKLVGTTLEAVPLFHLGRSGSTFLERSLAATYEIVSLGEVFNRGVTTPFLPNGMEWNAFYGNDLCGFLAHCVLRGLEAAYWQRGGHLFSNSRRCVVLFEYKPTLVEHALSPFHAAVVRSLPAMGIRRAVVLERRSMLRRVLSQLRAASSGIYHSDQIRCAGQEFIDTSRVELNLEEMLDVGIDPGFAYPLVQLQLQNDLYYTGLLRQLAEAGVDTLHLLYEDDIAVRPEATLRRFGHFVGLDGVEVKLSSLTQTSPREIRELVQSPEDLLNYCEKNVIRLN